MCPCYLRGARVAEVNRHRDAPTLRVGDRLNADNKMTISSSSCPSPLHRWNAAHTGTTVRQAMLAPMSLHSWRLTMKHLAFSIRCSHQAGPKVPPQQVSDQGPLGGCGGLAYSELDVSLLMLGAVLLFVAAAWVGNSPRPTGAGVRADRSDERRAGVSRRICHSGISGPHLLPSISAVRRMALYEAALVMTLSAVWRGAHDAVGPHGIALSGFLAGRCGIRA
jgi:hypothetical protein